MYSQYKYKYKYKYGHSNQEAQNTVQVKNNNYVKVSNHTAGTVLRVKSSYRLPGVVDRIPNPTTDAFHSYAAGRPESHYTRTINFPEGASDIDVEVEVVYFIFAGRSFWTRKCFWEHINNLPACFRVEGSIYTGDCRQLTC
jgi:hypothetical protein